VVVVFGRAATDFTGSLADLTSAFVHVGIAAGVGSSFSFRSEFVVFGPVFSHPGCSAGFTIPLLVFPGSFADRTRLHSVEKRECSI
jgi:hypothetical protein